MEITKLLHNDCVLYKPPLCTFQSRIPKPLKGFNKKFWHEICNRPHKSIQQPGGFKMKIQLAKMKRILMLCFVFPTSCILFGCAPGSTVDPFAPGSLPHYLIDPESAIQCITDQIHAQALENVCDDLRALATGIALGCHRVVSPELTWKEQLAAEVHNQMLAQILQTLTDMIEELCGDGNEPQDCSVIMEKVNQLRQNKMRCIHQGPTAGEDPDGWKERQRYCGQMFDASIKRLESTYARCLQQQGDGPELGSPVDEDEVPEEAPMSWREDFSESLCARK